MEKLNNNQIPQNKGIRLFKDRTGEVIAIEKDGNGKYWVEYGYDEQSGRYNSSASKFNTLKEAKTILLKHRPTARKTPKQSKTVRKQNSKNAVKNRFGKAENK